MARAAKSDFLQNFRFHVSVDAGVNGLVPDPAVEEVHSSGVAGFQSCTLPELTVEGTEYREGTFKYMKKFPGLPTVSDCTLIRGVTARDTMFFRWCMSAASGGEYRADISISQYARTQMSAQGSPAENTEVPAIASRIYKCHECMPIRVKPGADLDATSGEVSMQEVDFALEWFEIVAAEAPDGSGIGDVAASAT